MPVRLNDPKSLEEWIVKVDQRLRELEARRLDAGQGTQIDHATKQVSAKISDDPNNAATIGEDGGILATDTVTSASDHSPLYIQKYLNVNASVNSGTDTDIIWSAETTNGNWSTTSTDITIPEDGYYYVNVNMNWTTNATGTRIIRVYSPGTVTTASVFTNTNTPGNNECVQVLAGVKDFAAGTTLRVNAFQNSGLNPLTCGGPYFGDIRARWTIFKVFDSYPPELTTDTATTTA